MGCRPTQRRCRCISHHQTDDKLILVAGKRSAPRDRPSHRASSAMSAALAARYWHGNTLAVAHSSRSCAVQLHLRLRGMQRGHCTAVQVFDANKSTLQRMRQDRKAACYEPIPCAGTTSVGVHCGAAAVAAQGQMDLGFLSVRAMQCGACTLTVVMTLQTKVASCLCS